MTLWLRFDRNAILAGEIWRVITGHLAHLNWTHLILNIVGLALIWGLFDRVMTPRRWLQTMFITAIGCSFLLLLLDKEIHFYVGLSGVLHGLFMIGCLYDMRSGRWDAKLLFVVLVIKIVYEQSIGPIPGSKELIGGKIVIDAHMFGAIMGLISFFIFRKLDEKNTTVAN